jgi:hypothetical protein
VAAIIAYQAGTYIRHVRSTYSSNRVLRLEHMGEHRAESTGHGGQPPEQAGRKRDHFTLLHRAQAGSATMASGERAP